MWGVSLGGYYAPRAAAFEKRIRGLHRARRTLRLGRGLGRIAGTDARGFPRAQPLQERKPRLAKTPKRFRSIGIAQNITCPIFIVNGRNDRIVPAADAERLAREVKKTATLMMIEDGNHIATNRAYRWRSQSADWMKEQLG